MDTALTSHGLEPAALLKLDQDAWADRLEAAGWNGMTADPMLRDVLDHPDHEPPPGTSVGVVLSVRMEALVLAQKLVADLDASLTLCDGQAWGTDEDRCAQRYAAERLTALLRTVEHLGAGAPGVQHWGADERAAR